MKNVCVFVFFFDLFHGMIVNAALLKKQGKGGGVETGTKHKDDVKGAISGLLAGKQKESGQGPITDDTHSLLGMVDTYAKYEKMKKIGMPMTSIKNKMKLGMFYYAVVMYQNVNSLMLIIIRWI